MSEAVDSFALDLGFKIQHSRFRIEIIILEILNPKSQILNAELLDVYRI